MESRRWKWGAISNVNDDCWGICENCSQATRNVGGGVKVIDNSYACAADWPSGNANFRIKTQEWDCLVACTSLNITDLAQVNISTPIPGLTNGNPLAVSGSPFTNTATASVGCGNMTVALTVTMHWEVAGTFSSTTNDNICNATDLGLKSPGSGTTTVNYDNRCVGLQVGENIYNGMKNTLWYKFQTPSAPIGETSLPLKVRIAEDGCGSDNVNVQIYKRTGAVGCSFPAPISRIQGDYTCSGLNSDQSMGDICLEYGTEYYIQAGYSDDNCIPLDINGGSAGCFKIEMNYGNYPAYDKICNALDLSSLMPGAAVSAGQGWVNAGNFYNFCAGRDAGEPNSSGGDKTIWFKVKTGANVGDNLYVDASGVREFCLTNDGSLGISGAKVDVYSMATGLPSSCSADSLVTQAGTGSLGDDSDIKIECPTSNTWYYIQIQARNSAPALCERQEFNVRIRMDNLTGTLSRPINDSICKAKNIGGADQIVNPNVTEPALVNENNQCSSIEIGEPALGGANSSDRTLWYSFKTDANPPIDATIDASYNNSLVNTRGNCNFWLGLANGTFFPRVRVYKSNRPIAGVCNGIAGLTAVSDDELLLGIDPTQGSFKISCIEPNTWYYVQIYTGFGSICDDGSFDIKLKGGPQLYPGPDYICQADSSNVPGVKGFLGTLNSSNNIDLVINNQTTRCATVSTGEPDNTTILSGLNSTVWYRFTTPAADYPIENTLYHLYDIEVQRLGSSSTLTYPALYVYEESANMVRPCGDNISDYSNLTYLDRDEIDPLNILNGGDARVRDLCLKPNTNYFVQVDPVGIGSYVDFNIKVKKSAFRPADLICNATVIPTSVFVGLNKTTTISTAPLNGAPFFGLPHSNKCKSADAGEPDVSVGGPGNGTQSGSVWYTFTTDANPNNVAEWIEWDLNDYTGSRGNRGGGCILGVLFNSKINIYKSKVNNCVYPSLAIQSEYDLPFEILNKASIMPGIFRLRCPEPNTTYYVLVKDAGIISTCFEGVYEPTIKTAPATRNVPINDDPCGALFLGTVAVGGTLNGVTGANPSGIYNNFCSTPTKGFIADQTQPLERDVWFSFIAPPSGSVLVTAQSAPAGSPSADNDIDLQIAIWEPILGDANLNPHCSDPRYLWTPIISRDHDGLDYADVPIVSLSYYDIIDTKNNLFNEGNSLIATCMNPGKMYYMQVDGGEYPLCDFANGGDCTMGYFKLQIKDAGLYDMASMATAPAGNDEPCGAKSLPISPAGGPLKWTLGSNLCASAISDPIPSKWFSSDATVWYKFIAPASGKVKIRTENIAQIGKRDKANPNSPNPALANSDPDYHQDINLQLAIYTMGNCLMKGTLAPQSSSYDGLVVENNPLNDEDYVGFGTNGFDEYMVAKCLEPGREYYIMVDGENDPTLGLPGFTADIEDVIGDFRISVENFATVPASLNDNVCDAYEIIGVNTLGINANKTTGLFNNECATIEPNIEGSGKVAEKMRNSLTPGLINVTAKKTLWFKFRAPSSGKVKIEGINSGNDKIDIAVAVYDFPGENCNLASSGFKFAEDYDPAILTALEDEEVTVECLVPGRYYYLQVDGSNNPIACVPSSLCATGEFKVKITHLTADPRSDVFPQKNDNLCDAINLGNINPGTTKTRLNDNNRCSTEEINEPGGSGWNFSLFDDQERTVWYRFKTGANLGPLAPGKFVVKVDDPNPDPCFDIDIELFEYTGTYNPAACNNQMYYNTQFNNLLKVGKGTPISLIPLTDNNRSETIAIDCPRPNTEYFLRVSGSTTCPGFGATMGEFDVSVAMDGVSIMAAENDDICGAGTSVAGNLGGLASGGSLQRLNHNNFCASQELNEPNTTQSAVQSEPEYDETMWYRFRTPLNPGEIKVKLETVITGSFLSAPSLTVYKGQSADYNPCSAGFAGLIEVASDFGAAAFNGITKWDAQVTLPCPSANWYYFIQVDGLDASLWGFTLPFYDDNFVYNVKVTDDGSGSARPVNDRIENALPVDSIAPLDGNLAVGGTLAIKGNNLCATAEDNEPRVDSGYNGSNTTDHRSGFEDETVWYYFITPNKLGKINVKVQDDPAFPENFSPNFALFYNNGTNPTYKITGAPTSKIIQEGTESVNLISNSTNKDYTCLLPSTKYWIQVDGNDLVPTKNDQGHFIVTVTDNGLGSPGPNNDLICGAENLTASLVKNGTVNFNRTNYCSWEEINEPNTSGNMGGSGDDVTSNDYDETVWFKFSPAWEGQFTIDLSTGFNYILYKSTTAIYDCTTPVWNNLTRLSSSNGVNNETFGCLDNGLWYYLQVDGNDLLGDDVGPFDLSIKHEDATILNHDMICNAYDLGTISNSTSTAPNQNNICATQELGEPNVNGNYYDINSIGYDKTLWYRFRTPASIGEWNIAVNNVSGDKISGTFTLYQGAGLSACSAGLPVWSNITERANAGIANLVTGNNSLNLECFRLQPNTYYFLQVQGEDLGPAGGEVGTNFNVSVTHSNSTVGANDNVCTPESLSIGVAYPDNNLCATTQTGEPGISPVPQDPFTSGYDETMWYKFVAPPKGYVKIEGRSLGSDPIDLNMSLYELPQGVTTICSGGIPNWSLLSKLDDKDNLISFDFDYENECLIPGRTYFFKIDGGDVLDDRGNYTVRVLDNYIAQGVNCAAIPNDEPCALAGAFDISAWVREDRCTSGAQYYATTYSIFNGSPDIDCATRSPYGLSCGSRTNCSDYWFQFTVPAESEGGVKIQGEDEYGVGGTGNNSTLVIGAYRGNPCTGQLQFLGCDYGGFGRDVEFDIAAIPGEQIFLQVFNDAGAASPTYPNFGMCVSTQCAPKTVCPAVVTLENDIPQCWNLDEDNSPINNSGGIYGNCIPGGATSANYFTFSTECGATSDGLPDTLTVVYSVTNISSNTALAIYEDATPCDGVADGVLINCVPFGTCTGCSPSTTFTQTYQLDECKTYVIQILGEDDDNNGSSGQIYIFKSNLEPPILPVELLSFTGYHDGQNNVLNWITASEKNVEQFIVEKSIDGESYSAIGIVGANGNSIIPQDYKYYDSEFTQGNNYYRLKIVDTDGKFEYSNIIIIDVNKTQLDDSPTQVISVYPNPTENKTNVEMYVNESKATFHIKVVNLLGQIMTTDLKTFSKGLNKFEIDASNYAQGAYVISIVNKATSEAIDVKFVKQ